jgi:hypothetical protein
VPGGTLITPPGSAPVPGTTFVPTPPPSQAPPPGASAAAAPPPAAAAAPPPPIQQPAPPPTALEPTSPAAAAAGVNAPEQPTPTVGSAQIIITPPGTTFRVGAGPYTVPINVVDASRLSMVTLTLTFDPRVLRVRSVQEGSFMRTGGANATFVSNPGNGRVDITITRAADATGASGTGLLGAVQFDAIAPGTATLVVSGAATGPAGAPMGLQFRPVTVTVQ